MIETRQMAGASQRPVSQMPDVWHYLFRRYSVIIQIYLTNLLRALSLALELTSGGLSRHHWRTAMIATRVAEHIALPAGQRQTLLYAALLHDIGAAARWEEKNSLFTRKPVANLYTHAEAGYNLLSESSLFRPIAKPILHHHDHWDGSSPSGLAGKDIPLLARIINLSDSLEVRLADDRFILEQREIILESLAAQSSSQFDPELVGALKEVACQESFWLDLANPLYYENFFRRLGGSSQLYLGINDILSVAEIFATIVDRTSQYTARHSRSVAAVSAFLAAAKGYSDAEVNQMRIAGLLHDLGKLAVPNAVLEKPGKLTASEFTLIKQHPYYSHRILSQIGGFEVIADWAAFHHETLDGQGYPFRIPKENLRLGSRIIAVADVYAALTESRPYRQDLTTGQVEKIMQGMIDVNRIDGDIVKELFASRDQLESLLVATS